MTHSRALHYRPCAHKKYWGQRGKLKKASLLIETWRRKVVVIAEQAKFSSVQSLSRVQLCDPMNCSTPGLPVQHQLPEFTKTHIH